MTQAIDIEKAFKEDFAKATTKPKPAKLMGLALEYAEKRRETLAMCAELGLNDDGTKQALGKISRAFHRKWMMTEFPAIDLSFKANRSMWLEIERDKQDNLKLVELYESEPPACKIPTDEDSHMRMIVKTDRYCRSSIDSDSFTSDQWRSSVSHDVGVASGDFEKKRGTRNMRVTVMAKTPDGVTQDHVRRARRATSMHMLARTFMYELGIDLNEDLNGGVSYYRKRDFAITLYWMPAKEALSLQASPPRPKGDPAIVMSMHGNDYLIGYYDTPDERLFENLVREYSEGCLGGVLGSKGGAN